MRKVYYRSDFNFFLTLTDCSGEDIGWPEFDWTAKFYTTNNKVNAYTASCIGGVCTNVVNDNGRIHIFCDNQHMGIGRLNVEFTCISPDDAYPDGNERVVSPFPLDIELVRHATCCCPTDAEIQLMLPVIKWQPESATKDEIENVANQILHSPTSTN